MKTDVPIKTEYNGHNIKSEVILRLLMVSLKYSVFNTYLILG